MKTITAHMVVKNEDKYVWFAIMSVIEHIDKFLIFDTGSNDNTVKIIESIINADRRFAEKIIFEKRGIADRYQFAALRQEQVERTDTDWFFVLDGDEIWWNDGIKEAIEIINNDKDALLVAQKFYNCAGDIFHYRDFKRDVYNINDISGAINLRFYSKSIPGVHCGGYYGIEGYFDRDDREVQNNIYKTVVMDHYYFHASYIKRSSRMDANVYSRLRKMFTGWDYAFAKDFKYPEVFYAQYPDCVEMPFTNKVGLTRFLIHLFLDVFKLRKLLRRKTNANLY
ncbi:hypothetical protein FACS1894110_25110 [Spirochaetia bacterium]|nr:hypothetical protein FACS1894110_25110 [Spirochaetia bacterium]